VLVPSCTIRRAQRPKILVVELLKGNLPHTRRIPDPSQLVALKLSWPAPSLRSLLGNRKPIGLVPPGSQAPYPWCHASYGTDGTRYTLNINNTQQINAMPGGSRASPSTSSRPLAMTLAVAAVGGATASAAAAPG
jgi:hypothetical protein